MWRRVFRRAALYAAVALVFAPAMAGAEIPYAPTPDRDKFYAQPASITGAPGTILESRSITFAPQLGFPRLGFEAWQLKFVSRDHNDQLIAAVATVARKKPIRIWLFPAPKPKLVSYQYAEDSLGLGCAPSHQAAGEFIPDFSFSSQLEPLQYLIGLRSDNWTVVIPDHQGPNATYAVGKIAGQITLDGIRAALNFEPLGLSKTETPIALWGYSGGALATAWAATLKPSYAPELKIVGAASGGTPADLGAAIAAFQTGLGKVFFYLGFSAVIGVNRAYPELATPMLNEKGKKAAEATKDGCLGLSTDVLNIPIVPSLSHYTTVDDPLNSPGALATFPKINLPQPGKTPDFDMFVYQGTIDELIPAASVDALVKSWCAAGTPVHYWKVPLGGHITTVAIGALPAVAYLNSRLNGKAPALPLGTKGCDP
jgi:triacylglycerol lipase